MIFLGCERLKALWHIITWVIDPCTHRVGHEFFAGIWTEESFERFDVLKSGIEPLIIGRGGENDRHAIVNGVHEFVRLRRDDRTGFEWLPFSRRPVFPQSRKGERFAYRERQPTSAASNDLVPTIRIWPNELALELGLATIVR
jgi:hypothetical protein